MAHRPQLHHLPMSTPVAPGRPRTHSQTRSYSYQAAPGVTVNMIPAPPPYLRHSKTPDLYAGGYVAPILPGWTPRPLAMAPAQHAVVAAHPAYAQYHAPQPKVPPQPQGYGYFSWPSTSTVDEIPEEFQDPKEKTRSGYESERDVKGYETDRDGGRTTSVRKRSGLLSALKRRVAGPDVHLHMLLLHARPAPLTWDVRNSPSSSSRGGNPGIVLSAHDRAQCATAPPRAFMRITCDLMPWSFDVVAGSSAGGSPGGSEGIGAVTVGDVLDALHAMLLRRVRKSEWVIAGESMQEKVVRAFAWRCYNAPGPRGVEESHGPRRVDWLLKRTVFRGLSVGADGETFVLHLGQH